MAARKSCTKLTWAEAKSRAGEGGIAKKKGEKPKKLSHVEKVIAKQKGTTEFKKEDRAQLRKERRYDEKLAALAEKKAQARLEQNQIAKVKPHERARNRAIDVAELAASHDARSTRVKESNDMLDDEQLVLLAQCRETQLNEILVLESMVEEGCFRVCDPDFVEVLRAKVENWQADEDNLSLLKKVYDHGEISLLLNLVINDDDDVLQANAEVSLVLKVTFPKGYPLQQHGVALPVFEILYFYCSDKQVEVNADKQVEPIAHIDEEKLIGALVEEAAKLIPELCIYEVAVAWLTENLFCMLSSLS